jgi:hypothetical protein
MPIKGTEETVNHEQMMKQAIEIMENQAMDYMELILDILRALNEVHRNNYREP